MQGSLNHARNTLRTRTGTPSPSDTEGKGRTEKRVTTTRATT